MQRDLFVYDSTYLNTAPAPGEEKNDHKKNEKPLTAKEWTDKDFELDIDYIIEVKPKVFKVIEYFQERAKKLNEEYFNR